MTLGEAKKQVNCAWKNHMEKKNIGVSGQALPIKKKWSDAKQGQGL